MSCFQRRTPCASRGPARWFAARAAAGLFALTSVAACAQNPSLDAPPPGVPRPPERLEAPPPPRPAPDRPAAATLDGVVRFYLPNEFGDVEGIVANDGTVVRFPPHMGSMLVQTLKPGDTFTAQGEGDPTSGFRAYAIGRRDGSLLSESRPDPRALPPAPPESRAATLRPMEVHGSVIAVLRAPRGELDGVVLDDGSVVRLPRYLDVRQPTLAIGSRLVARGYGTQNPYGRSLRADAVGIDGQALAAVTPRGPSPRGPAGIAPLPTPADAGPAPAGGAAPPLPR